jgi:glycosyltransferase involved in cell wall biosynthesis
MSGEPKPIFYARPAVDAPGLDLADDPAPLHDKPLVSLVVPAYNEAAVVETNLGVLFDYMRSMEHKYDWEMLVVNDGSKDNTSMLAKAFAATHSNVFVLDHAVNFGLGQALKFAFNECRGDYIVTVDMDLSYSPDHIERLLDTLVKTRAKIVVASPYLRGGSVENVPELRRILSVGANKFLSIASHGRLKTLTGMVRAYDAKFLKTLDFYSMGMEVNSEILYKAMVLRARIEEIPAVLKWHLPPPADPAAAAATPDKPVRKSNMRIARYVATLLVSGFLYRPIMFFLVPGATALAIFAWCGLWMLVDIFQFHGLTGAWQNAPATFITGGLALLAAVQMLSCGLISLQNKCYFEQMFHLGTSTYRMSRGAGREIVREGKR